MNKISLAMLGILIVAVLGIGYFWGKSQEAKKRIELVEESANSKIAEKDKTINDLEKMVIKKDEEIEKSGLELEKAKTDLAKTKEQHKKDLEALRDAPPEHLLHETKRILNTDEIWQDGEFFKFSISAFRDNTIALFDWQSARQKEIPGLEEALRKAEVTILKQAEQISLLKLEIVTWKEKYEILDLLREDLKKFAKKNKGGSLLGDLLKFGAGYAAGRLTSSR